MSQKSELINELAKALCLAQNELQNAAKDSRGNFGNYASLASVRNGITPALFKHGLSIVQIFGHDETADFIETILMHTSGQWISGRLYLKIDKPTMQGLGSAISYARRYSLAAMVNIGQEDDDAQQVESSPRKEAQTSPKHESGVLEKKAPPSSGSRSNIISTPQEKRLFAIAATEGWANKEVLSLIATYGYQQTSEIDRKDYEEICSKLSKPKLREQKAPPMQQPPPFSDEDIPF